MPSLSNHQSAETLKMLLIGDSGTGKTGALASLAAAGYKLRVIDADNGLDVLANILSPGKGLENVEYITVREAMKPIGGKLVAQSATAWPKITQTLGDWRDGDIKHGPIMGWEKDVIFVLDSLSFTSDYAMNYILQLNGRLNQQPFQADWGAAQTLVENLLQFLTSDVIKCHVIVTAHITYLGNEGENATLQGYPRSLGKALPPKIGTYFNTMLLMQRVGMGSTAKQKIYTRPTQRIGAKNSAPLKVLPEYPIETGLADYFKAVLVPLRPANAGA